MRFAKPEIGDLWFREKLLADPETMSYNAKWGGTIRFPQSRWMDWYAHWLIGHENKRFYRYIVDEKERYVGEAALSL